MQKRKTSGGEDPFSLNKIAGNDSDALDAAKMGKDMKSKIDGILDRTKGKKGHWEYCCGVKIWVED